MDHVQDIADLIETVLKSDSFHALMLRGPAGLGKSTAVQAALVRLEKRAAPLGAYSTPLHLFNFLADHPADIVLIDDCAGLFQSAVAMSILKAATATAEGGRRVAWGSSRAAAVVPEFDFNGKIIFVCNSFPEGPDAEAIRSRSIPYDLKFSADDASSILLLAAASKEHYEDIELAMRVANFLNSRRSLKNSDAINFRTLKMGYEMARSQPEGRWQQLLEKLIPQEVPPSKVIQELERSGLSPKAQETEFMKRTGLARRSFYRLRREQGISRPYRGSENPDSRK